MPPPRLWAVWAIAPLGRDHAATRVDDALSERVPSLGAIVQAAVGKSMERRWPNSALKQTVTLRRAFGAPSVPAA
jgi:hypothetical protein